MMYTDKAYGMVVSTMELMAGELPGEPASPDFSTPLVRVNISSMLTNLTGSEMVAAVVEVLDAHDGEIGIASFSHIVREGQRKLDRFAAQ